MQQIPLAIRLAPQNSFASFLTGANRELIEQLEACAAGQGEPYLYFWGGAGTGKTHLLQAASQAAIDGQRRAAYIPLGDRGELAPAMLDDLEGLQLICLDDVQHGCGQGPWEAALFDLFNRLRENGRHLLVSADRPPGQLPLELPDLRSRLAWGPCYQVRPLDDEACLELLRRAAAERGMHLDDAIGRFILNRYPRDAGRLVRLIERLDELSLTEKRRPTLPLVRQLLQAEGHSGS